MKSETKRTAKDLLWIIACGLMGIVFMYFVLMNVASGQGATSREGEPAPSATLKEGERHKPRERGSRGVDSVAVKDSAKVDSVCSRAQKIHSEIQMLIQLVKKISADSTIDSMGVVHVIGKQ